MATKLSVVAEQCSEEALHAEDDGSKASEEASQDSNSRSRDYDKMCTICGNDFLLPSEGEEYDGDRCDLCDSPCHFDCLQIYHDLRGEWSLCCRCMDSRVQNPMSVAGDFRTTPASFWQQLYRKFPKGHVAEIPVEEETSGGPRSEVADIVELRKTLDSRQDYMLKYLELDSGNVLPQHVRDAVLQAVKATHAWQKQLRTPEALQAKVSELDYLMMDIVQSR